MCAGHTAPQRPGQGALFSPLPLTHAGESYLLHTISSSSPSPPIHSCYLWGKERWLLSHPRVKGSRKGEESAYPSVGLEQEPWQMTPSAWATGLHRQFLP